MSQRERAWFSGGEWTYNGAPVSVDDMNAVVERALKEAEAKYRVACQAFDAAEAELTRCRDALPLFAEKWRWFLKDGATAPLTVQQIFVREVMALAEPAAGAPTDASEPRFPYQVPDNGSGSFTAPADDAREAP
jgi:hypothetical protein